MHFLTPQCRRHGRRRAARPARRARRRRAAAVNDRGRLRARRAVPAVYATDNAGNLLRFRERTPRLVRSKQITGLPMGVSLRGIDFRPATGDLYALGSDKVVYRVNPRTAIAVAEGPAFEAMPPRSTATRSASTSTRPWTRSGSRATRTTTSASTPTRATCSRHDTKLTPADVTVVGSAYTNSSFAAFASRPARPMLFALDVGPSDRLWLQNPPNAGTLMNPLSLGSTSAATSASTSPARQRRLRRRHAGGQRRRALHASTSPPAGRARSAGSATAPSRHRPRRLAGPVDGDRRGRASRPPREPIAPRVRTHLGHRRHGVDRRTPPTAASTRPPWSPGWPRATAASRSRRSTTATGARVYGLGVHLLRDRGLAEDLVQETFVRSGARPAVRPGRASVRTFVFTLARRAAVDLSGGARGPGDADGRTEDPAPPDEAFDELLLGLDVGEALESARPSTARCSSSSTRRPDPGAGGRAPRHPARHRQDADVPRAASAAARAEGARARLAEHGHDGLTGTCSTPSRPSGRFEAISRLRALPRGRRLSGVPARRAVPATTSRPGSSGHVRGDRARAARRACAATAAARRRPSRGGGAGRSAAAALARSRSTVGRRRARAAAVLAAPERRAGAPIEVRKDRDRPRDRVPHGRPRRSCRRASTTSSGSSAPATPRRPEPHLRGHVPPGRERPLARQLHRRRRPGALPRAERHRGAGRRRPAPTGPEVLRSSR